MTQEPAGAAVTIFEEEIFRLHNRVEECRKRLDLCVTGCDSVEKASILGEIQKELDTCSRRLDGVTGMLDSLQEKRRKLQVFCSETAAVLEQGLKKIPPAGEEGFSPSSISPLA